MRSVLVLAAVLPLAACTTTAPEALEGPYATEGFSDGCRTAEARQAAFNTQVFRNEELFRLQPSYAAGWRQGYNECLKQADDSPEPTSLGNPRTIP
ncbi:hypothetical protein [Parvularcula maris]|uniref:Lipoprotein n=1 Tax=Parvularcula maris TaxID=2965077 RepID=A0A9X2RJM8_9PROT|nr:hypothetical protein [Parvularcula maris]MCQ8186031.1 hypothetical protein [Parvularcula maris]